MQLKIYYYSLLMTSKVEFPKKKPNHFYILNRSKNEYNEIKYLTQHELADGWNQVIPKYSEKKQINHFSVTLAFLPPQFWTKLHKVKTIKDTSYKNIIDGLTVYTIIETNQDDIMINLFNQLKRYNPNIELLNKYINDLDISQHTSWLVLRAKNYINHGYKYNQHNIINFN
jgi:hypothetical protein